MVSGFPVYRFNFYNQQFGYACGGRIDAAGVTWRTTNSGLNWSAQGICADEVFDIFILDSLNALTLSGDPEGLYPIADLKTTNAGINWIYEELQFFGLSFRIDFRTYNEGWSASGYKFLLTTNRGETWKEFETPDSAVVYDIQFLDARAGYAVGERGTILKLDPTLVGIEKEIPPPAGSVLYQNYPNPFNPNTKISWQSPVGSWQTLKVYDILGNEIATLLNEYKPAGIYEIEFNVAQVSRPDIASGVYFYQLRLTDPETGSGHNIVQTKKMIYLK
jgi:hypothetical protein